LSVRARRFIGLTAVGFFRTVRFFLGALTAGTSSPPSISRADRCEPDDEVAAAGSGAMATTMD